MFFLKLFVKIIVDFIRYLVYSEHAERGVFLMPNIKPVSELRNYGEVLRDVAVGQPVFLTKNGYGRYAVIDIDEYREYERMKAASWLLTELDKGHLSREKERWLPAAARIYDLANHL